MKLLPFILLSFFTICLTTNLDGQRRFDCDGRLLVSASDGKTTSIYYPSSIPFSPTIFGILAIYDGHFDAMGFNPKDNYVYSVEQNTSTIVRHSLYTTYERIGQVSIVDTLKVNAGDCTAEGLYVCYDYRLNKMLVFDVVDQFKLLRQIDLFWDPKSPNQGAFKTRIFDFAFDPNDTKTAYSFQGSFEHEDLAPAATRGAMLRINLNFDDPNLGMVTPISFISPEIITHIAGLVFDPRSSLHGYGSSLGGLNPPQNKFFSINSFDGQTTPILTASAEILSDACSCPFSLNFTNSGPTNGMFCNNDSKTFVIGFENNSYIPFIDVVLKDTFPEGTIIKSISNSLNGNEFVGKIDAGTGIGTNILSISGLLIRAKGRFEISVEIMSINANDGPAYTRAYLQNLPPRFPTNLASDDPGSSAFGDRTNFFFKTRDLENLSWKIIPPTDCIVANDGKIIVTSPEFVPGQGFEVGLLNRIGYKERFENVVIDDKKSFTIDSLNPGNYQLFKFRSLNGNCSLSLKDTTITLDPPNSLLDLRVGSNSPVCEGDSLLLTSLIFPEGQIIWAGPEIFGSVDPNPMIKNVTPKRSGIYDAIATYGYCIQKRMLEVEVRPQVMTIIEGDSTYCIRDTLNLAVTDTNKGELLTYSWSGPNNFKEINSVLDLPIVGNEQTGYYEVITTNGACHDTIGMDVMILPTPDLVLDNVIMTDYCDPLILLPKLLGDTDVNYEWTPQDGLSCSDCLSPEVISSVKSSYRLKVENGYSCADSASVQIILDKDNLIFAANIFSPAASAGNKQFKILPNCVVHYIHRLDIYDRYGNPIFQAKAFNPDEPLEIWDGRLSNQTVSSGVYVWFAKVELVDGSIVYLTGDVTVL